ncbi:hypothetical protein SY88_19840 [Clostridiales bacterium PH28_bin88]|nr:hypothetical protein SY88_19840 [Clostridiales bacterium PH28_bin88]
MRGSIEVNAGRCTGCRLCQLACSWVHLGLFNPDRSHLWVKVDEKRARFAVEFKETCNKCRACVKFCAGGALTIREEVTALGQAPLG